jgi:Protein of unknown function (DUF3572)
LPIRERHMMSPDAAEALAAQALLFLAGDDERLSRFAGITGTDPGNIRQAAAEPGFLAGVLAHLMQDEEAILAFAAQAGIKPVMVPLAYRVIPGGDPSLEINLDAFR